MTALYIFGGLLAEAEDNPLDLCASFAVNEAQRLFERFPVLVRFARPDKADGKYALQWHANAVEGAEIPAGPQIALRRLNIPMELTSGGFAPIQFWWTNRGPWRPKPERSSKKRRRTKRARRKKPSGSRRRIKPAWRLSAG